MLLILGVGNIRIEVGIPKKYCFKGTTYPKLDSTVNPARSREAIPYELNRY